MWSTTQSNRPLSTIWPHERTAACRSAVLPTVRRSSGTETSAPPRRLAGDARRAAEQPASRPCSTCGAVGRDVGLVLDARLVRALRSARRDLDADRAQRADDDLHDGLPGGSRCASAARAARRRTARRSRATRRCGARAAPSRTAGTRSPRTPACEKSGSSSARRRASTRAGASTGGPLSQSLFWCWRYALRRHAPTTIASSGRPIAG